MATITLGPGIGLGAGVVVGATINILETAAVYYNIQSATAGLDTGASVTSLTNQGTLGSGYNAASAGSVPVVAVQNSRKVLSFSGSPLGYNIPSVLNMSTGSMFFVGWETANRMIAFGGQGGTYNNCFYGYSANDNSVVLFRGTTDSGADLSGLTAVSGLKVFGIVKSGTSITYYDNTTTGAAATASGTFGFNAVGYRAGYGNQPSTGYLADLAYWSTALDATTAGNVVTKLKTIYNIT
jgi:hypothetical protein